LRIEHITIRRILCTCCVGSLGSDSVLSIADAYQHQRQSAENKKKMV